MSTGNRNRTSAGSGGTSLDLEYFRSKLTETLEILETRETAIKKDVRSGLNSDSKERAVQLENSDVLNALSDDASIQINAVRHALAKNVVRRLSKAV